MHCTSTTMASTAPVTSTVSVDMKLPACGVPWRDKHFQARAAHTHQVDSLGTGIFSGLDQGRFGNRFDHGFKQIGFMAVNDNINLVFL